MASLTELHSVATDPALKDKVEMALLIAAKDIVFEAADANLHADRVLLASAILADPNVYEERFTRFVVALHNDETLAEIQSLTDAEIKNDVVLGFNTFLGL